jgi:hypothetical protein
MIMSKLTIPAVFLPISAVVLLGGCASSANRPATYSYFAVPCSTPGAVRAVPISPVGPGPVVADPATAAPPPPVIGDRINPDAAAPLAGQCVVAVADGYGRGYGRPGYGYGGSPYYRSPYYGSFGLGIGFGGGHFGGHGGGHRGGHGGRRH